MNKSAIDELIAQLKKDLSYYDSSIYNNNFILTFCLYDEKYCRSYQKAELNKINKTVKQTIEQIGDIDKQDFLKVIHLYLIGAKQKQKIITKKTKIKFNAHVIFKDLILIFVETLNDSFFVWLDLLKEIFIVLMGFLIEFLRLLFILFYYLCCFFFSLDFLIELKNFILKSFFKIKRLLILVSVLFFYFIDYRFSNGFYLFTLIPKVIENFLKEGFLLHFFFCYQIWSIKIFNNQSKFLLNLVLIAPFLAYFCLFFDFKNNLIYFFVKVNTFLKPILTFLFLVRVPFKKRLSIFLNYVDIILTKFTKINIKSLSNMVKNNATLAKILFVGNSPLVHLTIFLVKRKPVKQAIKKTVRFSFKQLKPVKKVMIKTIRFSFNHFLAFEKKSIESCKNNAF